MKNATGSLRTVTARRNILLMRIFTRPDNTLEQESICISLLGISPRIDPLPERAGSAVVGWRGKRYHTSPLAPALLTGISMRGTATSRLMMPLQGSLERSSQGGMPWTSRSETRLIVFYHVDNQAMVEGDSTGDCRPGDWDGRDGCTAQPSDSPMKYIYILENLFIH